MNESTDIVIGSALACFIIAAAAVIYGYMAYSIWENWSAIREMFV
jgi:hypothetical protein